MRQIEITFEPDVKPERQKAILENISGWSSIEAAVPLMPNADDAKIKRMAFAYIKDDAKIEAVSKQLEKIPEIKIAIPPKRELE
ncbi:hypothetical protein DXT99_01780 [Pontibacter diazotrophicus]|uniref:Uncharacterized protein n=1 Tax=Pontibacter diazotrophicus TaxID=1400979 RepID=A0A3D8LHQ3_9BACT|nr:hypothetical protein [Pontibacter diazotrophicus]RDV16868.1 hypothetical protein DXT99_01780 [Pontibacter diazotrophicus]